MLLGWEGEWQPNPKESVLRNSSWTCIHSDDGPSTISIGMYTRVLQYSLQTYSLFPVVFIANVVVVSITGVVNFIANAVWCIERQRWELKRWSHNMLCICAGTKGRDHNMVCNGIVYCVNEWVRLRSTNRWHVICVSGNNKQFGHVSTIMMNKVCNRGGVIAHMILITTLSSIQGCRFPPPNWVGIKQLNISGHKSPALKNWVSIKAIFARSEVPSHWSTAWSASIVDHKRHVKSMLILHLIGLWMV